MSKNKNKVKLETGPLKKAFEFLTLNLFQHIGDTFIVTGVNAID